MADIFISYARADRDKIEKLAAALEGEGYTVWWDRHIESGAEFSADIERELEAAKAVIVCWSQEGAKSLWVKDEATIAHRAGKLKTISLDGTEPPIGYMQFHSHGMSSWKGGRNEPQFVELKNSLLAHFEKIGATKGSDAVDIPPPVKASWTKRLLKPVPLAAMGVAFVAGVLLWHANREQSSFEARSSSLAPQDEGNAGGESATVTTNTNPHPEVRAERTSKDGDRALPPEKSIAVLPFADMSAAGDQEYFADGISEEILNVLVRLPGLKVAGRTSSFSYKGRNEDLREIGSALGVNHILEGSIRRSGERLRITAQLIRSVDGFHLWSETYDRELTDIFSIQDDIAKSVADELAISLGLKTIETKTNERTDDTVAYENYLRAKQLIRARGFENLQSALVLLQEATSRDQSFAPAWVGVAMVYSLYESYAPEGQAEREHQKWRAIGRAAAERALSLDSENAEAFIMIAQYDYYDREFVTAIENLEKALALAPDNADVHDTAAQTVYYLGYFRESLDLATRAVALDPLAAIYWNSVGHAYYAIGDVTAEQNYFREAINQYLKAKELNPELIYPYISLAWVYYEQNRLDELEEIVQSAVDAEVLPPDALLSTQNLIAKTRQGDDALRSALNEELPYYRKLQIADRLNDTELAIEIHERNWNLSYQHEVTVLFDSTPDLRKDPRWKAQVRKSGLLDLWRTRGFPSWCRPAITEDGGDNDFECD